MQNHKHQNLMEKVLSPSHIRYGRVGISKKDIFFPKGCEITISCDGVDYKCSIPPAGTYISGLGECHRLHKAIIGSQVKITPAEGDKNRFILEYLNNKEADKDDPIHQAKFLLETYPWLFCKNETTVRCEIIDPILKLAGWEFPDLRREVYMGKGKGQSDYILYQGESPKVIIEAKSHDNDLKEGYIKKQLLKYWKNSYRISNPKDLYAIATNGQEWQLWRYNNEADFIANADIIDSTDNFKLFVSLLKAIRHNDSSSISEIIKQLHKVGHDNDYSFKRHYNFKIKNIDGCKSVTDYFQKFIAANKEEVQKMADKGYFNKNIIATTKQNAKEQFGERPYDEIEGLYITADYDTYTKRMIIEQIINTLHLEEKYQLIKTNDPS